MLSGALHHILRSPRRFARLDTTRALWGARLVLGGWRRLRWKSVSVSARLSQPRRPEPMTSLWRGWYRLRKREGAALIARHWITVPHCFTG